MKSISLKTLTVLIIFIFLLVLRFKLFQDRQNKEDFEVSADNQETVEEIKDIKVAIEIPDVQEENKNEVSDRLELSELIEIYEQRRLHVGQMCREHQREIEQRYAARWPDKTWDTFVSKADIMEKTDQGFLWCKVPKAASESWTTLFINRWFRSKSNLLMWKQQVYLHSRWQPKYKTAPYLKKISKTHFNFVTIRHPFERILSAYRDKFFLNGNAKFEHDKVQKWYGMYGKSILNNYRKTAPTDEKYNKAPTFREFIEYLVELPITKFDDHWKPMYMQCMPCHIQYRVIARLETLARDSEHILQSIGVSSRLPKSHTTQGKTTDNLVSTYYSQINKDLLSKLYNLYKFDFLLFNFTATEYDSYVQQS